MSTERTPPLPRQRFLIALSFCTLIFLGVAALAPFIGPAEVDLLDAIRDPKGASGTIMMVARIPRVLLGLITGAALAGAGVALQALLRNPLATPYTLGVSSGASLGAVIAIFLGFNQIYSNSAGFLGFLGFFGALTPTVFALLGATATSAVVYLAASRPGRPLKTETLLLAGVCLAFCLSAAVMLLHYLADMAVGQTILRWLMGGLVITDFYVVLRVWILASVGLALIWVVTPQLNILTGGEDVAKSRGVDVARTQRLTYIGAALATAAVVSETGPIGFVGLVIPHSLRLIIGPDHRILLPCSALIGGAFLVLCDGVARVILAPAEIPVGVLTAMIGGPFLVWLLRRRTL